jgi:hypothetical protein
LLKRFHDQHANEDFIVDNKDATAFRPIFATVEQFPNARCQSREGERLAEQLDPRREPPFPYEDVAGIGSRHQYLEGRPDHADAVREAPAVHGAGKAKVGKEKMDLRLAFYDLEGGCRIDRLKDGVAELSQAADGIATNVVIVLDDKNYLSPG